MSKEQLKADFSWVPIEIEVSGSAVQIGIWEFRKPKKSNTFYLSRLSRTGLNRLFSQAGFYKLKDNPGIIVREVDSIIEVKSISDCKEFIKSYLDRIPIDGITLKTVPGEATKIALMDMYYRQYGSVICKDYLEHLDPLVKPILKDGPEVSYVPFRNALVKVTSDGIKEIPYKEVDEFCIWKDQIIDRDYHGLQSFDEAHFVQFLRNVTKGDEKRFSSFMSAIGYLLHNHSKPSLGQALIFYDEKITDPSAPEGGTGKGLIANAVRTFRNVIKIDGKRLDPTHRFAFQLATPSTQIIWIDDVASKFDFSALFSLLTDGLTVEKKNQSSFLISPERSPKILICSNTILESGGSSNKRRQLILELGDFYSSRIKEGSEQPIFEVHGCMFFDDDYWDQQEWGRFHSFMLSCLHLYLAEGLIQSEPINLNVNRDL